MYKEIYFAGGCFWGVEQYFAQMQGVVETQTGYANGRTANPSYEDVCQRDTGHAETVRVAYDPHRVGLAFLLDMLYEVIDPTALNRQGNDVGTQYRTGIYYVDTTDIPIITASLQALQTRYSKPLAVEVQPLANFYPAEEYHQKYLEKNPGGYCHIPAAAFQRAREVTDPARAATPQWQRPTDETLRQTLTPLQYEVTRHGATEPPFKNEYNALFEKGIYVDVTTGEPLFLSTEKFESGCGWPAFSRPIDDALLESIRDSSHGMIRTEVRSRTGNAHLGHVFPDGPKEKGGLRYCINSAALRFIPLANMEAEGYAAYLPLLAAEG